jgi:hypothetical protein
MRWHCILRYNVRHWNCRDFTLCEIDEVHLILEDTFFKPHMIDVRRNPVRL